MKRIVKALIFLGIFIPQEILALGLGEFNTYSALNQPFNAELEVIATKPGDLDGLDVQLASEEEFSRAGIEWLPQLTSLRFKLVEKQGKHYVQITSAQAIREPYLNFLLQVNWSRGRLLREFTVLLDPPELLGSGAPSVATPAVAEPAPRKPAPPRTPAATPPARAAGSTAAVVYGPVQADEQLWNIASQIRREQQLDASVQQVMMALLRNNPEAFIDNNVNSLKRGYVLRIDKTTDITAMDADAAQREFKRQYQLWQDYKQQRARQAGKKPPQTQGKSQPVDRKSAGERTQAPAKGEGVLSLVRPEAEKPVGGHLQSTETSQQGQELETLRKQLAEAKQSAAEGEEQNEAMRERLKAMEDQVAALQRLMDIRSDEMTALQLEAKQAEAARSEGAAGEEGFSLETVKAQAREIVHTLKSNPQTTGILGGGFLLLVATLWFLVRRRRMAERYAYPTSRMAALDDDEAAFRDMFATQASKPAKAKQQDDDPITQADIFVAYGNLDAAIEVMEAAVNDSPEVDEYQVKLGELLARRPAVVSPAADQPTQPMAAKVGLDEDFLTADDLASFEQEYEPAPSESGLSATPEIDLSAAMESEADVGTRFATAAGPAVQTDAIEFSFDEIEAELEKLADTNLVAEPVATEEVVDFDLDELEGEADLAETAEIEADIASVLDEPEMEQRLAEEEALFELADHEPDLLNDIDEVGTKLDLARAYIDMGDPSGARSILNEVLAEGNEQQIGEAQALLALI